MGPSGQSPERSREAIAADEVAFGRYVLERRLAVGGMSEVYLAHPRSGSDPAPQLVIKRLLPGVLDDPSRKKAFEVEAKLHAAARHANVVEVFEAGQVDGEPYLALELVSGVDAFRLMRRAQVEQRSIPPGLAVYVARELAKALSCVHALSDDDGNPLGVVHRDVTPSNVYLSDEGDVKLGDFGIARTMDRSTRPPASHVLKGKYAYLSPEQVAGEAFDHRADLFSLFVILSEMLIGRALFPGAGQLAVLLAIRDCRIDPLREARTKLPPGLFAVLERGLAKNPDDRFASADEAWQALGPFEKPSRSSLRRELAGWVDWARDSTPLAQQIESALRESTKLRPAAPVSSSPPSPLPDEEPGPPTSPAHEVRIARIRRTDGRTQTQVPFAKLVEMIATNQLGPDDEVDTGNGRLVRLGSVEELARHLPPSTGATAQYAGPGTPDYAVDLAVNPALDVLSWLLVRGESGAIFVQGHERAQRKEIYVEQGKLLLVSSNEPSEMFGEYLVRRGALDRAELEMALLAMPKYGGRLGNTLIALGLVDAVQVFRAIRYQGRDRVADLFRWPSGLVTFYRGVRPAKVEFPLDLDLSQVILAGLESDGSDEHLEEQFQADLETIVSPVRPPPAWAKAVSWPQPTLTLLNALAQGRRLGELLDLLASTHMLERPDALRSLALLAATGMIVRPAQPAG